MLFFSVFSLKREKVYTDLEQAKSLLKTLLSKPPKDQIIINNEFQGMVTKLTQ